MHSVEYIPKKDRHNCWNQHVVVNNYYVARLYLLEAWLRYGRDNKVRIREF